MTLNEVMRAITSARAAHLRWVARAEALVAGLPLDKEQVPVLPTDCQFGSWYYDQGQVLKKLPSYQALETPHNMLHRLYMDIFRMLFGEDGRSMLGKLFGSQRSYREKQLEGAAKLLPNLRAQSELLLKGLDMLEQDLTLARKRVAAKPKAVVKPQAVEEQSFDEMLDSIPGDDSL